ALAPLQAYIDEANASRITGWIWNPALPEERIVVDLVDGDIRLARVAANQYRSDLRQAGIGDGSHAFTFPLGTALLPQARHILRLRLADTGAELPGSPVVIERPLADAAPSSPVSLSEELFAEHFDRFVDGSPATDAPATVAPDR